MNPSNPTLKDVVERRTCHAGGYHWQVDLTHSISWDEEVWVTRLFSSLMESTIAQRVRVIDAYIWNAKNWDSKILSVFTNLTKDVLRITPFHGMTDILLMELHNSERHVH